VFTPEHREAVRERLVALARADADVVAAAHTGSFALDASDGWSDIDLALSVRGDTAPVVERWTTTMRESFGAFHHWDLPVGRTLYRVFLLPDWLEVDIAFAPEDEFGPRGPKWRPVFGTSRESGSPTGQPAPDDVVGLCWHHVLHTAACIERRQPWRAEWFIAQARHHVLELACRRLGLETAVARGTDRLPPDLLDAMADTLVGDLDDGSLWRALSVVTDAFLSEVRAVDPPLADRLGPLRDEVTPPR
jgi:hypothetical protein